MTPDECRCCLLSAGCVDDLSEYHITSETLLRLNKDTEVQLHINSFLGNIRDL